MTTEHAIERAARLMWPGDSDAIEKGKRRLDGRKKKKTKGGSEPTAEHRANAQLTQKQEKVKLAKHAASVIEAGSTIIPRHFFIEAITKRAEKIRKDGESSAQAFTRALETDEKAKTLYVASKVAPGPDVRPASAAIAKTAETIGEAHSKLEKLAESYRSQRIAKGFPCSPQQAFTAVFTDPANIALREAAKREEALRRAG